MERKQNGKIAALVVGALFAVSGSAGIAQTLLRRTMRLRKKRLLFRTRIWLSPILRRSIVCA